MDLTYTKVHSGMQSVSGMGGNLRICRHPVFAGQLFPLIMLFHVQWVVSLPYGIMSCGILLHHLWQTSAVTLHKSLPYSLSRENHSLCPPLWMVLELMLTSWRMVSGAFLIRVFFDVSVVNPFCNSYKGLTLPAVSRNRECEEEKV